ncbi:unnamed protein product, partial [Amoebophrya sp. A25]|eukprot:GSA25T00026375001.1
MGAQLKPKSQGGMDPKKIQERHQKRLAASGQKPTFGELDVRRRNQIAYGTTGEMVMRPPPGAGGRSSTKGQGKVGVVGGSSSSSSDNNMFF